MSARLPLELRQGIVTQTLAWFVQCTGAPGSHAEPKSDSLYGMGDWGAFNSAVRHAAYRTPYAPIGDYMDRYWFLPDIFGERARVHCTKRSDRDRHSHDHPWHFVSIILEGGYTEEIEYAEGLRERHSYRPGDVLFRHAEHRHRLEIAEGGDCWSLVFTSPNVRDWGFWTPEGFVPWREYDVLA